MLTRAFYFGLTYFHFLDDYNTYGIFNRRNADIWNDIILHYGHFTFRPIAFFADAYITQWFWGSMWLVLLFYTLMHFATVYIFYKVLQKSYINFSAFGIIIISLTPILFEAVYWIGASTRLVPGMFFSILSVFFLMRHVEICESNYSTKRYLVYFFIFNFLSIGFYEQIVVFNLAFTLLLILLNFNRFTRGLTFAIFTPIFNTAFIGLFYVILAQYGRVATRGQTIAFGDFFTHFSQVSSSIGNMLINVQHQININGFLRGLTLIQSPFGVAVVVLTAIFALVVFLALKRTYLVMEDSTYNMYIIRLLFGLILTIAPFAPFFMLQNAFLAPRTVYPAIFGIAIILDTLVTFISSRSKYLQTLKPLAAAIFIVPFFIIYIAEINNFKLLEKIDVHIMDNFLEAFYESGADDQANILLFNTQYVYADITTDIPHRLENITSSDWALIGKANAASTTFYFRRMVPVQHERTFPADLMINNYALFGVDEEFNVFKLQQQRESLYIYGSDEVFGTISEYGDDNKMFLRTVG